jgi:hypothetical protein
VISCLGLGLALSLTVLLPDLDNLDARAQTTLLAILTLQSACETHEVVDDVALLRKQGQVQRDLVLAVGGGGVRTSREENLDDLEVAAETCPVQRGVAELVGEVEVGLEGLGGWREV